MFDHLLESSHQDNPNKLSHIGFGQEITQVESIEVMFTDLIWSSESRKLHHFESAPANYCRAFFHSNSLKYSIPLTIGRINVIQYSLMGP